MKITLKCPVCNEEFKTNWPAWVAKAPFHTWTARWTKCPKCGKRSLMKPEKKK